VTVHGIGAAPVTIDGIDGYVLTELLPDQRVHLAWRSTRSDTWPAGVWTKNVPLGGYWAATVRLPELSLPRFENYDDLWLHVGTHAYTGATPLTVELALTGPPLSHGQALEFTGHWTLAHCELADLTRKDTPR
jgi:hypothetical protein